MKTKIGGQAVLEGIMMRGQSSMALACRDESGNIRMDTTRLATKKPWYRKVPFLRGVVNLVVSMIDGYKIIGKSAEVMAEEEIDTSDTGMGWMMTISMLLGVALALGLFVVLPTAITAGVFALFRLDQADPQWIWLKSLLEGLAKILVLVGYMGGVSQLKEIRRVFMYHGAEHKTIACYEAEMPLTVENVKKCSRYHDRCGTSFLVFVVVLSVILMMVLDIICMSVEFTAFQEKWWLRALLKIALLPVTAGLSYEMLMLLARSNFILFRPLKWFGKQFQKLTTKEPDDSMCEVAIAAFNQVLAMDADTTIPEEHFPDPISLEEFSKVVESSYMAQSMGHNDTQWLLSAILKVKKDKLKPTLKIPFGWTLRVQRMDERVKNGEPLAYVLGNTEFFDHTFVVDKNVLIPRLETELVCEKLLQNLPNGAKLLDLCCGSGVLGITAALNKQAKVTLADLSKEALKVAKRNAKLNKVRADIVHTDMFQNIKGKFDAIVCNPPYIPSQDIATLDESVRNYEPIMALDGGADGLDFYRILAEQAPSYLEKNGLLVLEIGYNQGNDVVALLSEKFTVELLQDYSSNDRIIVAHLL